MLKNCRLSTIIAILTPKKSTRTVSLKILLRFGLEEIIINGVRCEATAYRKNTSPAIAEAMKSSRSGRRQFLTR